MALGATIYRVTLDISDVDRGVYERAEFRIAQHPSEDGARVVARILAFALCHAEGLDFGPGLGSADEPALRVVDPTGRLLHWIDVGVPGADRLHLAAKRADRVTVLAHKGEDALARETGARKIHRAEDIEVIALEPSFVADLAGAITRTMEWTVVQTDGDLSVTIGDATFAGTARRVPLHQPG